ncbi:carbohydrate porin [Pseudanabaena sp. FACHB-1998]|uniref:iron uptake porin n=1 Tax=Pseudanabaena sp. FACHB-1998 TaxID=2692858 RepID=UPI0016812F85|nr:iron uptake porin [Pseudanabaena sp. FACHB-1998]MBD2175537.1 carbohydrate porin [Pseudanabaena sp. FACHB-1998]
MKINTSKLGLLLLSFPLSLGAISVSAEANPTNSSAVPFTENPASITEISSENQLKAIATDPIAQNVTSVSQLSDVRPTDWAFTALQSLVERYGCIAGYPDRTFRGKQATSRYEFAAGLNACLDKINEIISAGLADKVSKEDLATLQKLQEEFASELATLRGRVDALDAKTAKLEAQQFSTTTKLSGEAIFSVSGATGANPNNGGTNTNIVFNNRVRLNLLTSFSGKDLLITGLQATNISSLAAPLGYTDPLGSSSNVRLGFENQFLNFNPSNSNTTAANSVNLYKLLYIFPVADKLTLFAGSSAEVSDAFPAISPFASEGQGSISRFGQGLNAATRVSGGTSGTGLAAAVGFIWNPSDQVDFRALYGSVNPAIATSSSTTLLGAGFFGGSTIAAAQLTLKPTSNLDIGLNYANSYHQINILGTGLASADINAISGAGTALTDPIKLNSIGSTLTWRITPKIAFNLSGAWIFANLTNKDASTTFTSWMTGFQFSDVFKEGNTVGLIFGQPLARNAVGGIASIPNGFTATPYQLEGYFNFKLSKNISVTPGVFFVFNPEGINNAPTATVGVLRTTFTF